MTTYDEPITLLLNAARAGDHEAKGRLLEVVYGELQVVARAQMAGERADHTLQSTALVHEAYLRVLAGDDIGLENRRHLFGAFAEAMRRTLIDTARARGAAKRGGGRSPIALDTVDPEVLGASGAELSRLSDELERLEDVDPRGAEVVRLRFFAGLSEGAVAELLGVSTKTVQRDWRYARAWLRQAIERSDG